MKKTELVKFGLFMIVLWILIESVNSVFIYGAKRSMAYQNGKINRLMEHKLDPEIIIFGSSVAFVHFNDSIISAETKLTTYNFGLDGTPYLQFEGLINEYLTYTVRCKFAVFAFVLQGISDEVKLYEPYRFYQHLDNTNIYNSLYQIEPSATWKMKYFPGYSFTKYDRDFYSNVFYGWKNALNIIPSPEIPNGYFPKNEIAFDSSSLKGVKDSSIEFAVSERTKNKIRSHFWKFQRKGITPILILTPTKAGFLQKVKNLKEIKRHFKEIVGQNAILLDYTDCKLSKNESLFYNYTHLNKKGAELFSELFSKDLIEINRETYKKQKQGKK